MEPVPTGDTVKALAIAHAPNRENAVVAQPMMTFLFIFVSKWFPRLIEWATGYVTCQYWPKFMRDATLIFLYSRDLCGKLESRVSACPVIIRVCFEIAIE